MSFILKAFSDFVKGFFLETGNTMKQVLFYLSILLAVPSFSEEKEVLPTEKGEYTECAAVKGWLTNGGQSLKIADKRTVKITKEWEVVGTSMAGSTPVFFLCK